MGDSSILSSRILSATIYSPLLCTGLSSQRQACSSPCPGSLYPAENTDPLRSYTNSDFNASFEVSAVSEQLPRGGEIQDEAGELRRAGRSGGLAHRERWAERTWSTEGPRGGEKLVLPQEREGRRGRRVGSRREEEVAEEGGRGHLGVRSG